MNLTEAMEARHSVRQYKTFFLQKKCRILCILKVVQEKCLLKLPKTN